MAHLLLHVYKRWKFGLTVHMTLAKREVRTICDTCVAVVIDTFSPFIPLLSGWYMSNTTERVLHCFVDDPCCISWAPICFRIMQSLAQSLIFHYTFVKKVWINEFRVSTAITNILSTIQQDVCVEANVTTSVVLFSDRRSMRHNYLDWMLNNVYITDYCHARIIGIRFEYVHVLLLLC